MKLRHYHKLLFLSPAEGAVRQLEAAAVTTPYLLPASDVQDKWGRMTTVLKPKRFCC